MRYFLCFIVLLMTSCKSDNCDKIAKSHLHGKLKHSLYTLNWDDQYTILRDSLEQLLGTFDSLIQAPQTEEMAFDYLYKYTNAYKMRMAEVISPEELNYLDSISSTIILPSSSDCERYFSSFEIVSYFMVRYKNFMVGSDIAIKAFYEDTIFLKAGMIYEMDYFLLDQSSDRPSLSDIVLANAYYINGKITISTVDKGFGEVFEVPITHELTNPVTGENYKERDTWVVQVMPEFK